jgi:hypothetical protein
MQKYIAIIVGCVLSTSALGSAEITARTGLPSLKILRHAALVRQRVSSFSRSDDPPKVRGLSYRNKTYNIRRPIEDCLKAIEVDEVIRGKYAKRGRKGAPFVAFLSLGYVKQERQGIPTNYIEIDVGRGKDPLKLGREDKSTRQSWTWIEETVFFKRNA